MPSSIENEIAVLGSIIQNPKSLEDVVDIITPNTFHDPRNSSIYKAIVDMYNTGKDIDTITLKNQLEESKLLERCGGIGYIATLQSPSSANIKTYANKIIQKEVQRKAISTGEKLKELGIDNALTIEEIIESSEREVMSINKLLSHNSFQHIKQVNSQITFDKKKLKKGVETPFTSLSNLLGGFQKGSLVILGARPAVGKTSFALDIVRKACVENKVPVGVISLEMDGLSLAHRLLAAHSGVEAWKVQRMIIKEDEKQKVQKAIEEINTAPLFIDDTPAMKIANIRSSARRLKQEHKIEMLVVDYLQLITPSDARESTVQQITEISRGLKLIARELQIPVVSLAQLSRAVEQRGGKPRLSDLRDSGSIEQDADVIMFLHKENTEEGSQLTDLLVQKHRNGATADIQLLFKPEYTTFIEVDKTGYNAM